MVFVWHLYGKTELLMHDNWGKLLWIGILGCVRLKNAINLTPANSVAPLWHKVSCLLSFCLLSMIILYVDPYFFIIIICIFSMNIKNKIKGNEGVGVFIRGRLYGVLKKGANRWSCDI